jgi:dephospho-CoA kinase
MFIGLTGGMGCGKSTAARFFEEFGFARIDSDALVRERVLTAPGVVAEAARRFGSGVLDAAGRIDRAELARVIFADDARRLAWEDFVLPRLYLLWRELRAAAPASARWIVEAPLLHEKELEKEFDFIVCVASSTAHQYARLTGRGISQALAGQRISKQLPLAKKIELADFVLSNDGDTDFLRDQIRHLAGLLKNRAP